MSDSSVTGTAGKGTLYVISAPSGAGKTTLVKAVVAALEKRDVIVGFSISYTTRPMRPTETNGVDYHFVNTEEFAQLVVDDALLEHADVFGNRYGTGRKDVDTHLDAGRDVILEIDWQGAQQVRSKAPDCISIFILPPSRAELEKRLCGRGEDAADVIERRLSEAAEDMSHCTEADHIIINDDLDVALESLLAIFINQRTKREFMLHTKAELLQDLTGTR